MITRLQQEVKPKTFCKYGNLARFLV